MKALSAVAVEMVSISEITVGVRRRKKLGNVEALARSISERGLIHPILLRGTELVAGARRLRACEALGWSKIPARCVERMTDEELRAVELEENTARLDLDAYETAKARLAEIREAEATLKAQAVPPESGKTKGGRPSKGAVSRAAVAAVTGISRTAQIDTERHVEIAEQHPLFQHPSWPQYRTLEAGEVLAALPATARDAACVLVEKTSTPPAQAIAIFRNLVEMPDERRAPILRAALSDDRHIVTRALTDAAKLPPVPDEGLTALNEAIQLVRDGAKLTRFRAHRQTFLDLIPPMERLAGDLRKEEEADRVNASELP